MSLSAADREYWLKIKTLFSKAVVLDHAARRRWYAEECLEPSVRLDIESLVSFAQQRSDDAEAAIAETAAGWFRENSR